MSKKLGEKNTPPTPVKAEYAKDNYPGTVSDRRNTEIKGLLDNSDDEMLNVDEDMHINVMATHNVNSAPGGGMMQQNETARRLDKNEVKILKYYPAKGTPPPLRYHYEEGQCTIF